MDSKKVVAVVAGAVTPARIAALFIIAIGLWGLIFGHFSLDSSHETQWRGIDVSLKDRMTIYIPTWVSIGTIVFGALLMLARQKTGR